MAVPDFCTLDGSVSESVNPYRPGISDVGGASFIDDADFPPDPNTMLTASVENQNEQQIVALARVAAVAIINVKVVAGTPAIYGVFAASSLVHPVDITVTKHSTGDIELSCPASKLIPPFVCLAATQQSGDFRISAYVNATSDGVRVETRNSAGTLADCNFVAYWI